MRSAYHPIIRSTDHSIIRSSDFSIILSFDHLFSRILSFFFSFIRSSIRLPHLFSWQDSGVGLRWPKPEQNKVTRCTCLNASFSTTNKIGTTMNTWYEFYSKSRSSTNVATTLRLQPHGFVCEERLMRYTTTTVTVILYYRVEDWCQALLIRA